MPPPELAVGGQQARGSDWLHICEDMLKRNFIERCLLFGKVGAEIHYPESDIRRTMSVAFTKRRSTSALGFPWGFPFKAKPAPYRRRFRMVHASGRLRNR